MAAFMHTEPYQIFISEASGAQIKKVYDYKWTDEII